MSRPTATPVRPAVRRILGALLAVCAVALAAPEGQARVRFPGTIALEPLRLQPRASANPGYLPLVGSPALRWLAPAPSLAVPTPAPVVLYNPVASAKSTDTSPHTAVGTPSEPGKAPPVRPKDFLPFFQPDDSSPPASANPSEGLLFTPARPALPTSSAAFRQQ